MPTMTELFMTQITELKKEQEALMRLLNRAVSEGREDAAEFLQERNREIAAAVRTLHFEILFGVELTEPRAVGRVTEK